MDRLQSTVERFQGPLEPNETPPMAQWRELNLVQPYTDKLINYLDLNEEEKARFAVEVDSWGNYFGIY